MIDALRHDLQHLADPQKAALLARFFKTGQGEYGEGDIFLGIKVPELRAVAKKYAAMDLTEIESLLLSGIHEHRLTALLILVRQYQKASPGEQRRIFKFYLAHAPHINNWDLVDLSAPNIPGDYLLNHPAEKPILDKLAASDNLWERRIAILSTFAFIRSGQLDDAFRIAEALLNDKHDLIHKAVGWMLREAGKRNQPAEERFLGKHLRRMPRTMLRYAIEKFPEAKRQVYLKKS